MDQHESLTFGRISKEIVNHIKIKNKTKLKELSVNMWLLNANLKPGVLMDFCKLQIGGFFNFAKTIFGDDGLVMKLDSDYLIVKKSCLLQHLDSVLTNPPVIIDISDFKSNILEDDDLFHQNILSWIKHIKEKLCAEKSYLLEIESEVDWNLCTIFGILLGYPTVYWFNTNQDCKSLNNQDILLVTLKFQHTTAHSFSVPYKLFKEHQQLKTSVTNWTITLCGYEIKNISSDFIINESVIINGVQFELDIKVVNLPFVAL